MAEATLKVGEMKTLLKYMIKNNNYIQEKGKVPIAVEVEGNAGLGKTSAIEQVAKELSLELVKINLSMIEELGDIVGFPLRQFELCLVSGTLPKTQIAPSGAVIYEIVKTKKQILRNGKFVMEEVEEKLPVKTETTPTTEIQEISPTGCIWVDEQAISEYIKNGYSFTGNKRMSYCPPEWIEGKGENGILLLDDYNRADFRMISACMEIINRQEYISWKLPKGWTVILSCNPDNGSYLVNSEDDAQKTRRMKVVLSFCEKEWAEWAEREGIDGRGINFLLLNPDLVKEGTNPRSITNFFNSISSLPDFHKDLALITMIGEGSVGQEFTQMFALFINNKLDKLVKPEDILLHENEAHIIGELRSCIGTKNDYRSDIASILATRIMNYGLTYAEKHPITEAISKRVVRLVTDPDLFTDDLNYHIIKTLLNGNKQKWQRLMTEKKVVDMAVK